MSVTVCLPLYGNPGRELEGAVRPRDLRELGERLLERLSCSADVLQTLQDDGWSAQVGEFDVMLTRPGVQTQEDAERALARAGVDLGAFLIFEDLDEE
jgi:hypothetical protein